MRCLECSESLQPSVVDINTINTNMESFNPAGRTIATLTERDIPANPDEIKASFNNSNNTKWAKEHLTTDTLLSKEELTLYAFPPNRPISLRKPLTYIFRYSKLEASGSLENVLRNPDLRAIRPFLEQDIQPAIESLKASTSAIQKQTEILNSQWEKLNKHIHSENERSRVRGRDVAQLWRKHEQKRQTITAAVRCSSVSA